LSTAAPSHLSRSTFAPATLRALLRELVDYAGLFPPAGLPMEQAVRNYARYRVGQYARALGRFVTSIARLDEFETAFAGLPPQTGCWRIAALLGDNPRADFASIQAFNERHAEVVMIDVIEAKTPSAAQISALDQLLPADITAYCEISQVQPAPLLSLIHRAGLRAKIRTGGLTAEAFPPIDALVDFLSSCASEQIAFKATAGLHHPLRCNRPLTYEPHAASSTMHGFLNVFLAAVLARRGAPQPAIREMLEADDGTEFKFSDTSLEWRNLSLSLHELADTRANFAISFGSCSFEEPISDLQQLHLL